MEPPEGVAVSARWGRVPRLLSRWSGTLVGVGRPKVVSSARSHPHPNDPQRLPAVAVAERTSDATGEHMTGAQCERIHYIEQGEHTPPQATMNDPPYESQSDDAATASTASRTTLRTAAAAHATRTAAHASTQPAAASGIPSSSLTDTFRRVLDARAVRVFDAEEGDARVAEHRCDDSAPRFLVDRSHCGDVAYGVVAPLAARAVRPREPVADAADHLVSVEGVELFRFAVEQVNVEVVFVVELHAADRAARLVVSRRHGSACL